MRRSDEHIHESPRGFTYWREQRLQARWLCLWSTCQEVLDLEAATIRPRRRFWVSQTILVEGSRRADVLLLLDSPKQLLVDGRKSAIRLNERLNVSFGGPLFL